MLAAVHHDTFAVPFALEYLFGFGVTHDAAHIDFVAIIERRNEHESFCWVSGFGGKSAQKFRGKFDCVFRARQSQGIVSAVISFATLEREHAFGAFVAANELGINFVVGRDGNGQEIFSHDSILLPI